MDVVKPASRQIDRPMMLLTVLLGLSVAALFTVRPWRHSKVVWGNDVTAALSEAKRTGHPVFVELYATWCPPCRMIERDTFAEPRVGSALANYSPVLLNYDVPAQQKLAANWGATALPSHILLRPDGTVQALRAGYMTPDQFKDWLDSAATRTR